MAVNGEIRPADGLTLPSALQLIASLHDEADRVLAVIREPIESSGFYGFQAFSMGDFQTLPDGAITKVKLYPQGIA